VVTPVPLALVDHHVHGVATADLDQDAFESLLTEAGRPAAPPATVFDTQLGFAVRRWCAPVLGLDPAVSAADYLGRRADLGTREVTRRLLRAAEVRTWLVDTGYQPQLLGGRLAGPAELAEASGSPARQIVRLEAAAEAVARDGIRAWEFAGSFAAALARAIAGSGPGAAGPAVAVKSIAAYRYGLDFDPSRPSPAEVSAAAGRYLRAVERAPGTRLGDPVLLRHLIWTGIDAGLPVQFHTGFGDPDARLHRANPSLLHDFLRASEPAGTPVMLLHCYPYHREAGYLANVFPHVYVDVGEALNHVGARSAAVLAEALELTPFHKMLYSSDAFGLPELHYLGAVGFRRDISRITSQFVADGAWSEADAARVAEMIGSHNAERVYRLAE
jgi:uncharacterized protein